MKRSMAMVLVLVMALVCSGLAFAEEKKPDATLSFRRGRWPWALAGVGGRAC